VRGLLRDRHCVYRKRLTVSDDPKTHMERVNCVVRDGYKPRHVSSVAPIIHQDPKSTGQERDRGRGLLDQIDKLAWILKHQKFPAHPRRITMAEPVPGIAQPRLAVTSTFFA
jgi:hypothetical protein